MLTTVLPLLLPAALPPVIEDSDDVRKAAFAAPIQILSDGKPLRMEAPGYASPAFQDMNADGIGDLVVGQFAGGKMKVLYGKKDGTYGDAEWLKAEGKVAEVPGVW